MIIYNLTLTAKLCTSKLYNNSFISNDFKFEEEIFPISKHNNLFSFCSSISNVERGRNILIGDSLKFKLKFLDRNASNSLFLFFSDVCIHSY